MEAIAIALSVVIATAIVWYVYIRVKGPMHWSDKANAAHFFSKDNRLALTYIKRALSIDPKNKDYMFLKSHLLHELGRHEEARNLEARVNAP